ncbi:hypothetical protein E2C01_050556 [Portunus trituberculatus]|uniref:Uncharacterized protein n=1 Tax=Portunus trituberculatus TaxID=210409 RepID=A0A5B7GCF5_PORTR|nr:hypothetical protein [Portunus trituberculatus]
MFRLWLFHLCYVPESPTALFQITRNTAWLSRGSGGEEEGKKEGRREGGREEGREGGLVSAFGRKQAGRDSVPREHKLCTPQTDDATRKDQLREN